MRAHGRGFTLLELLTVLTLALLLIQIGLPGLSALTARNNRSLAVQATIGALDRARYLAVTRNKNMGVCMLANTRSCSPDWTGDYIAIFIDGNKNRQLDKTEEIIYQHPWPAKSLHLRWGANWLDQPIITYQPNGSVESNGTLHLVDENGFNMQSLVISKPGRMRIE